MGDYHSLLPKELLSLNEAALDQALLKRGIQFVLDDPYRYVLLSLSRIPPFFMFWPANESGLISNLSRVGGYAVFLPFMLAGLGIAFASKARRTIASILSAADILLLVFCLIYSGIHILTWTLVRYRLPIDAVMLVYAGLALASLLSRLAGASKFVMWLERS